MKKWSKLFALLLVLIMAFSFTAVGQAEGDSQIVILHTNDVHSRVDDNLGYAGVKSVKDALEAQGKEVLLLDAGDALHGLPLANLSEGMNIVEIMNAVGYTAMAPGNHDFNYGTSRLLELEGQMNFDLLSANVTVEETGAHAFTSSKLYEAGNKKVGIVGLTTPETVTKADPRKVAGYSFNPDELADILQGEINKLKGEGADYIVALGHLGIDEESRPWRSTDVIAKVSGLDIFVDGHSHSTLESGRTVKDKDGNDVVLAQTGTQLAAIGKITIDDAGIRAELVTEADKDEAITALIGEKMAQIQPLLDRVVAKTDVLLNGERDPGVRTQETNLGDLVADALKAAAGSDIAVTNGGGIRASVDIGDITYGELNAVLPFGNLVTKIEVTGKQIVEALEFGAQSCPTAAGGFLQVAGLEFEIHTYVEYGKGERIQNVKVNGAPIDLNKTYTLATNDFMAAGGDGYEMFGSCVKLGEFGAMDEALINFIVEDLGGGVGQDYAKPQGRIVIKSEAGQVNPPATGGASLLVFAVAMAAAGAGALLRKRAAK